MQMGTRTSLEHSRGQGNRNELNIVKSYRKLQVVQWSLNKEGSRHFHWKPAFL